MTTTPFQRWLALPNLAVLDSETTGLRGEVVELAIVDGQGRVLFDERIKPCCPIEPGAHAVHGITDADLAHLPGIEQHWPRLSEIFQGHHMLIYNRPFDLSRLDQSFKAAFSEWADQQIRAPFDHLVRHSDCVMRAYKPGGRWAKLTEACRYEQVKTSDLDAAHSALGDALRTLRLVQAVAKRGR